MARIAIIRMPGTAMLAYKSGTVAGIIVTSDREEMSAAMQTMPVQNVMTVRRVHVWRRTCP
jgi:hypothetical protein